MSSLLCSHGMALVTAMAVSGTVLLLTLCRQKPNSTISSDAQFSSIDTNSASSHPLILRSCISSDGKKKKKKRVSFANDVVDSEGKSEEFRRKLRLIHRSSSNCRSESSTSPRMPANHKALYNGIRRDRLQRTACSY